MLSNAWAVKAERALGETVFIPPLPLLQTKGKGSKAFGLTEVHLRVAELFALREQMKVCDTTVTTLMTVFTCVFCISYM